MELIFQHLAGRTEDCCRSSVRVNGKYQNIKYFFKRKNRENNEGGSTYEVVELDVDSISSGVYHFIGVCSKAIHVPIAIRGPLIGENSQYLVRCFWTGSYEVPHHVRILREYRKSLIED